MDGADTSTTPRSVPTTATRASAPRSLYARTDEGIAKVALVVFARNADGNAFWQRLGFTSRDDLTYRNKALAELTRIDT